MILASKAANWRNSIEIDGIDVRKVTHESLAHRMGIVLQEPFLFSGTVAENIRYGRPEATGRRGPGGGARPSARTTSSCGSTRATTRTCTSAA